MGAPTITKTVRGKPVSQRQWRKEVLAAIDAGGPDGSRIAQIAERLGEEWTMADTTPILSTTLQNLKARGIVDCPQRGVWVVVANAADIFTGYENLICARLADMGGIATTKDLAVAFGVYNENGVSKPTMRSDESREAFRERLRLYELEPRVDLGAKSTLHRILEASDRLRQDMMVEGVWNLPLAELHALPMVGRWVYNTIRWQAALAAEGSGEAPDVDLCWAAAQRHYEHVGAAFQTVREMRRVTQARAVGDDLIRKRLAEMRWRCNTTVNDLLEQQRLRLEEEGLDVEARDDARAAAMDFTSDLLPVGLLDAFEQGVPEVHRAADAGFYHDFAGAFSVDPVTLSRGIITAEPPEHKMRPAPRQMTDEHKAVLREMQTTAYVKIPDDWLEEPKETDGAGASDGDLPE